MDPTAQPARPASAAAARSRWLADTFAAWCRRPRLEHAACVLALAVLPLARWGPSLTGAEPLGDEPAYSAAFVNVAAGASPYDGTGFVYPAAFAFAGAWGVEHLGLTPTLYLLRAANLLGLAIAVWCALAWLPRSLPFRLALAGAYILLAPQAADAIRLGNVSLAASGLVIAGLLLVPRSPLAGGGLLGVSLALKPIAPMVIPCLLLAVDRDRRQARVRAAGIALLLLLVLVFAFPYADKLLALQETPRVAHTVSLHRLPKVLGYEVNALWLSAPLALAALALLRRHPLGRARFLCFATAASLVVLPLVWSHTLVLALPLEVLALTVAVDRWRRGAVGGAPSGRVSWFEPVLVGLAVASLQLATGAGTIDDQGLLLQAAAALLPALAPIGLLAYLLAHTEAF
jgi:hypothetical protein